MLDGHPTRYTGSVGKTLKISLICAASQNGVIGKDNRLPWRLPADLKRFKQLTLNHPVIMGRKTYESIGKALPGRTNVIVTRQKDFKAQDCRVAHSLEEALRLCKGDEEVFVIGGASLYEEALKRASKIYLTRIHHDFEGDTTLFHMDMAVWKETQRQDFQPDRENPYPFSFITLERSIDSL